MDWDDDDLLNEFDADGFYISPDEPFDADDDSGDGYVETAPKKKLSDDEWEPID